MEAVGFFIPQASGVSDAAFTPGYGAQGAQRRDEVGDGPGIHGDGPERPGANSDTLGRGLHLRAHFFQQGREDAVPLKGGQGQSGDGDFRRAQGPDTQKRGGGGPVPLHDLRRGESVALAAGNCVCIFAPVQFDAPLAQDLLRQGNVGGGLGRRG